MAAPVTIIDPHIFRRACARFATGVTVATAVTRDGEPCGLTANSFTSVSCSPPLVLICVDYRCSLLAHFRSCSYFGVNILCDQQQELSTRFSQPEANRFEGVSWRRGRTGVPVLEGVLAALECCVTQTIEAGDHAIFIGEVVSAEYSDGKPLLYFGSAYRNVID